MKGSLLKGSLLNEIQRVHLTRWMVAMVGRKVTRERLRGKCYASVIRNEVGKKANCEDRWEIVKIVLSLVTQMIIRNEVNKKGDYEIDRRL